MDVVLQNYRKLVSLAEQDPEYNELEKDFIHRQTTVQSLISRLSGSDREILMDYLGTFGAMEHRLVELACFQMHFEDT